MAPTAPTTNLLPFHVRTVKGDNFTQGFQNQSEAIEDAMARTAKAEEMGLKVRYRAVPKP